MNDRRIWRHFDYVLLAVTAALVFSGLVMIHSATQDSPELGGYAWDQAAAAAVGFILLFILAAFDYRLLANLQRSIYLLTIGVLLATSIIGHVRLGAQRWLGVGNFVVQPSEFAKILALVGRGQLCRAALRVCQNPAHYRAFQIPGRSPAADGKAAHGSVLLCLGGYPGALDLRST
jgi:cell division protein FtsW (lipid II flippase)